MLDLGRKYNLVMPATAITAAKDVMRISAGSAVVLAIIAVKMTQEIVEVSETLPLLVQRCSTDGTGTSGTAEKTMPGDPTFAGTFVYNLSSDTTLSGGPFHRDGQNVLNGWDFNFESNPLVLAPSGRAVVRLPTAPAASLTFSLVVTVVEIG